MMTKMEIASHLAVLGIVMADGERGDKMFEKTLEAIREAQMIMYNLALTEIAEHLKEANDD